MQNGRDSNGPGSPGNSAFGRTRPEAREAVALAENWDVTALGELLVDFTRNGVSAQGNGLFEANPGGAPCNVLAMLTKLGKRTAFIGKVGRDMFGDMLGSVLESLRIDTRGLVRDPSAHTTLAFVQTAPDGDRDFSFYRDPGADCLLRAEEVEDSLLRRTRAFHFGSLSLTHPQARAATRAAVAAAQTAGALISFDPNLRVPLWENLDFAREQMLWGCGQCDMLKVSDEELRFLTGCEDIDKGQRKLRARCPGVRLLLVTMGPGGSWAFCGETAVFRPAWQRVHVVDTTGAGDCFCGCCLNYLLDHGMAAFTSRALEEMLDFANAAAALVTTRKGAVRSMPDRETVAALMRAGR